MIASVWWNPSRARLWIDGWARELTKGLWVCSARLLVRRQRNQSREEARPRRRVGLKLGVDGNWNCRRWFPGI
ncbi:hypothetical protein M0R45_002393 [Rubus argutus]|uniref:Uncharacterized protein n=1 Tax=Rubus argutus TaxID=59490 RepID=A0AAW1VSJ4_RUBAR